MSLRVFISALAVVATICAPMRALSAEPCDPANGCPTVGAPTTEDVLIEGRRADSQLPSARWFNALRHDRGGKPRTFILDPRLLVGADNRPCVFVAQLEGDPTSVAAESNE